MKISFSRAVLIFLCFCTFISNTFAQKIDKDDLKFLSKKEDTLVEYAEYFNTDTLEEDRMISDSVFTRTLVKSLVTKNSFSYPFSRVKGISILYAPDSAFRIFTWNLIYDEFYCRQRGAIQMRTPDGSLKLYPLRDCSEFTDNAMDSIRTAKNWIGAVYYNIVMKTYGGKKFYTLFGIDYNNVRSTKKWVEVLQFSPRGEPLFGGSFVYTKDSVAKDPQYRLMMEYKKNARILCNYIDEQNMILMDYLFSETDQQDLPWTFIPDGETQGYRWDAGKWVHVEKVFKYKLDPKGADMYKGYAPIGDPLYDPAGGVIEQKNSDRSKANKETETKKKKD